MSRNTDLSSILFDVELQPICLVPTESTAGIQPSATEGELFPALQRIPQYRAVVRIDNGTVFSVVSDRYELLHNSRALDLGRKAFQMLFPDAGPDKFQVYDIRTTKTGSACHIDLIHEQWDTTVWDQETWLPFLRVSNSYNRYRALTFDFGFVRSLCSNGMIFSKRSIQAKYHHTRARLSIDLEQDRSYENLKVLEQEFSGYMRKLRAIELSAELLRALSLHLLGLSFDLKAEDEQRGHSEERRLKAVAGQLDDLTRNYLDELGPNAYTAINIATDLATHSPGIAGGFCSTASLQEEIGARMQKLLSHDKTPDLLKLLEPELALLQSA